MSFPGIAIVGCGLIGGSFALALKKNGFVGEIVGCDREEVLAKAKQRGAIDRGTTIAAEAVASADLVYLATPVLTILELLPQVGQHARAGALITDAGSTKVRICRLAREVLPAGVAFLGGHPLAGKEKSGIENADADLLVGAKYVVIREAGKEKDHRRDAEDAEGTEKTQKADPSTPPPVGWQRAGSLPSTALGASGMTEAEEEFLGWVRKLGAEPVELDAETHDWAVALVSHLPQLLSTALATTVWEETEEDGLPLSLAASGFLDMTRLAGSPYDIWRDICLTNSENIARALERLEQKLERLRANLRSRELAEEFAKAQQTFKWLRSRTAGEEAE